MGYWEGNHLIIITNQGNVFSSFALKVEFDGLTENNIPVHQMIWYGVGKAY